jgi:IS5 family transposase
LRQKDRDARWTAQFSKAKPREDGAPRTDLAVPAFGYKNHIGIVRGHGLIRSWTATNAAAHDGARLEDVLDADNTARDVWAGTAYRSAKNEAMLAARGLVLRIHRKKPKGRPMPERTRQANARKSMVRPRVEHVFAHQKGLMVQTIDIARATVETGLANFTHNIRRMIWLSGRAVPA